MQSITYQLILMITIYVLLGCIVYLLAQKENEDELTNGKQLFYLFCGLIFKPVIKTCICLDTIVLLHIEFKDRLNDIFKMFERHELRKPTRSEKKEIKRLLKLMVSEGESENE